MTMDCPLQNIKSIETTVLEEKKPQDNGLVQDDLIHRATVQLLPGRLEPLIPEVIQQEVRFQGTPGTEHEITLGWELGDPPHHVTLDHPSIQPLHAKMTFQFGSWMIESLAPKDPVEILQETIAQRSEESGYLLRNWIETESQKQKEQVT